MHDKKNLLKLMKKMSVNIYETEECIDTTSAIKLMSLDDLCDFVIAQSINTIFFHYSFLSPEMLIIDDDTLSEIKIDESAKNILSNEIEYYNSRVNKLDYSQPINLEVYCIFNGIIVYIEEFDYWFQKKGFDFPEIVVVKMMTDKFDEIVKHKTEMFENITKERELLKQRMLSDSKFHNCTNATLRREYAGDLIKDQNIHELFYKENGLPRDMMITSFVELVWKEYKTMITK